MENRVVNTIEYWNGNLYIGTDKGLDVVDSTCRKQIANDLTKQFEGVRIRCLDADDEGNLWICTYGNGLIEVEPDNTQHLYNSANGSFGNRARLVTQLRDGTIAAAGDMGISFIRDHEIQKTIRYSDGLINSMILTLVERTDGRIFAGTDGDGIAVIEDGRVMRMITRADGLSSGVILRMIPDPKTDGVFVVTSNGLCYMDGQDQIRLLDRFPYFNNYDIWVKDPDTLFVMSSAGIYVVDRDSLVDSEDALIYDLLDAKRGLNSAITANSWTYSDGNGDLFLACDTGVFVVDTDTYASGTATYRMSIRSVRLDGNLQQLDYGSTIQLSRDTARIELYPEIINFTIQDPDVGYKLDGFDTNWSFVTQSELNSIVYTNLPSGEYTLHLAVFDGNRENILEERQYRIVKAQKINDNNWFVIYIIVVAMLTVLWITYFFTKWRNKREIDEKNRQLAMGNQTILAIANTVDAKDVRTSQHSLRVSIYSEKIGHKLGLSEQECKNLESAARLHDIGKIGIPDVILNKPSRLTDEEYAVMKSHVMRGANILKGFTLIDHVVEGAMYHHERYDGKGYPKGLKGEEIPLYGRIIGVADAFDAMTANRVYRKQMDFGYVLNEMRNGRGTQFDPQIVDILLKLIDDGEIDLNKLYPAHTDNEKTE